MWSEQPSRDVFSIHAELRFLAWGGVMLIATGAGIWVSKNLDAIGPATIALILGVAAAACYAYAWWKRSRPASLVDDYVLLLGALLLSTDVGFIEHQWHLLGQEWPRHFLLLAVVHAVAAYLYDSRLVLSLSVGALAAWLGIERNVEMIFEANTETGVRALICAAIVLVWRLVNRHRAFDDVFDHFIAHLAFLGGVLLLQDNEWIGLFLVAVFGVAAVWIGFRRRAEAFVVYAWGYGAIACISFIWQHIHDDAIGLLLTMAACVVLIAGLIVTHARFKREKTP
jgi:hypothetical protein